MAELLERETFQMLKQSDSKTRESWWLDTHPTACGFAAGFDRQNVLDRSLREATERWVMSLWIDEEYIIDTVPKSDVVPNLDPISKFLYDQFDEIIFYFHEAIVSIPSGITSIPIAQTMAIKQGGIFPGSSTQLTGGSYWQHALVESFRHLMGYKNNPRRADRFPDNKVIYFATNADVALRQIERAQHRSWPIAKLLEPKLLERFGGRAFVARSLIEGWRSWHEGPLERFLY